jgi:hypothetical protein
MLTFAQFAAMQNQMLARSLAGPSGNVNPFDNLPMGTRHEAGRGNPDTIYAQAIQRMPSMGHTHEIHIDNGGGPMHGRVVTYDYVYAAHPKINPDGNGNFMSRPHQKNIMTMPD